MKIYLHIGTEKTGTTAIQSFLAQNRTKLLESKILYPESIGSPNNIKLSIALQDTGKIDHNRKVLQLVDDEAIINFRKEVEQEFFKEIEEHSPEVLIISSEHLSSRLIQPEELSRLYELLQKLSQDITVVVYLRRQDEYYESLYSTSVKAGNLVEFGAPEKIRQDFWYNKLLEKWENIFGLDAIKLRIYDRDELYASDVVADFINILQLPLQYQKDRSVEANTSLGRKKLGYLKLFNKQVPTFINNELNPFKNNIVEILEAIDLQDEPVKLSYEEKKSFLLKFEKGNQLICKRYFPDRTKLFKEIKFIENEKTSLELTAEEIMEVSAKVWMEQHRKNHPELTLPVAKKRVVIVHVHIFKNAGSTFDWILEKNFGSGFLDHREPQKMKQGGVAYLKSLFDNDKNLVAVSSHHISFNPKEMDSDEYLVLPVYIVREPITRMMSVYKFEKKQNDINTPGAEMAKKLNFNEFVKWSLTERKARTLRNMNTMFVSGIRGTDSKTEYEAACKNLENTPLVATVDRFDECMELFETAIKEYFPDFDISYEAQNVNQKEQQTIEQKIEEVRKELDKKVYDEFVTKNQVDIELYEFTNILLDERKNEEWQLCDANIDTITNAHLEKTNNKKTVFVLANCQGRIIKSFFRKIERLSDIYDVYEIKPIHLLNKSDSKTVDEAIRNADVFIYQPISSRFGEFSSDVLKSKLKSSAISISFPVIYFSGYNPELTYLKDKNNKKVTSFIDYHDMNILKAYQDGLTIDELLKKITTLGFYSESIIKKNIEDSLNELKNREKSLDVQVADYIKENMFSKRLFYSMNHPSNEIMFNVLNQILSKLSFQPLLEIEKSKFPKHLLGKTQMKIYPDILNFFKIENKQFIWKNQEFEYKKLILQYFNFYNDNKDIVDINLSKSLVLEKNPESYEKIYEPIKKNIKLIDYLKTMKLDFDATEIINKLLVPRKSPPIPNETIKKLVNSIITEDDAIAVGTIIRRFLNGNENKNKNLKLISEKLQEFSLPITKVKKSSSVVNVSLLTSVTEGSHLEAIFAYAASLITNENIKNINVIFTGEWEWAYWQKMEHVTTSSEFKENFFKTFGNLFNKEHYKNKIDFHVSPSKDTIQDLLGDIVIKFIGSAIFRTTHLYAKSIYENFPVALVRFSALAKDVKYYDNILVKVPSDSTHILFSGPSQYNKLIEPKISNQINEPLILTIYSKDRIQQCLKSISLNEWNILRKLFQEVPNIKWKLIGSNNVEEAFSYVPEDFKSKIEITGPADLQPLFNKALVFLAFSNIAGGAGTSRMSIAKGVPVLCTKNLHSDISITLTDDLVKPSFKNMIECISKFIQDENEWIKEINKQQSHLTKDLDYYAKGKELYNILNNEVLSNFNKRIDKNDNLL